MTERGLDALRALAILGVVLGDWLATAVVLKAGGHLVIESPLSTFAASPLFFFVSGSSYQAHGSWRERLARPVMPYAGTWAIVLVVLAVMGTAPETMRTFAWVALSPLWFLLVYALVTAATPVLGRRPRGSLTKRQHAVSGGAVPGPLRRALTRHDTIGPLGWGAVATLNVSAVTVFLWHQTAMLGTTVVALGLGHPVLGLHTTPDGPMWLVARLGWSPVFTAVLVGLCVGFRGYERKSSRSRVDHTVDHTLERVNGRHHRRIRQQPVRQVRERPAEGAGLHARVPEPAGQGDEGAA